MAPNLNELVRLGRSLEKNLDVVRTLRAERFIEDSSKLAFLSKDGDIDDGYDDDDGDDGGDGDIDDIDDTDDKDNNQSENNLVKQGKVMKVFLKTLACHEV